MDSIQRGKAIVGIELEAVEKLRRQIGGEFARTVDRLLQCIERGGKVVVTGVGKSLHIAQKVSATLASTGTPSVVLNPTQALHGDLGILRRGDVLLAFSYSGESDELLALLPPVKRLDVGTVAVCGCADSTLGRYCDIVVPAAVDREACPFNLAPTSSTTAALVLGDALAMVVMEARGLDREDYARLHPGGAIGRALLLRVAEIMRTGERLARVGPDDTVRNALLAMTRARAGSAGVADDDGRLLGVFTDGDLRRLLAEDGGVLDRSMREVMHPSPVTLREDALAADALLVFEQHNIDDILVVDAAGRLAGAVDIQDLPKLKIL